MRSPRRCSRNACPRQAVATLTYVYADSTAVVGPLAINPEPHTYDLCESHARSLTAPRGWELVRFDGEFEPPPPTTDDLVALADAVREAARPQQRQTDPPAGPGPHPGQHPAPTTTRRGHLRAVPPPQ